MAWDTELLQIKQKYLNIAAQFIDETMVCRRERRLPIRLWDRLAKEGLMEQSLTVANSNGIAYLAAAIEGIAYGSMDGGISFSLGPYLIMLHAISKYAKPVTAQAYLPLLKQGAIVSLAITEPHSGTDDFHLETRLKKTSFGYLLNGEKWHITNAPIASIIVTAGREETTKDPIVVLLEASWEGIDRTLAIKPLGLQSSPVGKIIFSNVHVPESHILGTTGDATLILHDAFTHERVLFSFGAIGLMERLIDNCLKHTLERTIFNKKISEYQSIQKRLTDMQISLETTRCVAHACLKKFMEGEDVSGISSVAKLYAAESAVQVAEHAIKIFGCYGIQEDSAGEILISAMAGTIGGGTEERQREAIYQSMYRDHRKKSRLNK